jgi:hypothetical protein
VKIKSLEDEIESIRNSDAEQDDSVSEFMA